MRRAPTLAFVLLVAGCGSAPAMPDEPVVRRTQYEGTVLRTDLTARTITIQTTDGERSVRLVERTQIVDTSGGQRTFTSIASGTLVQATMRSEDGGQTTPAAELVTILPSGAAPESVIEPPEND